MTELSVKERKRDLATTETVTWEFDITERMVDGDVLASPTSSLFDITTGKPVTLADPPVIGSSTTVEQIMSGGGLQVGNRYRLVITFSLGAENTQSTDLEIHVPY